MKDVIRGEHFVRMKEGAIVCNTGHYDVELNRAELAELATDTRVVRDDNREYTLDNGRKIFVLADGRLVNLAAAEGHPSEVMDMSFANQFMAHLSLVEAHKRGEKLERTVIDLPEELDQHIAQIKLETMGISIDALSDEQVAYASDYSAGTGSRALFPKDKEVLSIAAGPLFIVPGHAAMATLRNLAYIGRHYLRRL